jgi:hypothetical protein
MELVNEINEHKDYKGIGRYQLPVKPSIYRLYKEYVATGKFPYLREVAEWIESQLKPIELDEASKENLRTEIHICAQQYRKEEEAQRQSELAKSGYLPLTVEAVQQAGKRNMEVIIRGENILGWDVEKKQIMRPVLTDSGKPGLLPKGARTKGYWVERLIGKAMFRYI